MHPKDIIAEALKMIHECGWVAKFRGLYITNVDDFEFLSLNELSQELREQAPGRPPNIEEARR